MSDAEGTDPFERAWSELEQAWEDQAAHRKFIAYCSARGALGEAGRRYRLVREADPARAEQAKRGADAVLVAALQGLKSERGAPEPALNTRLVRWVSFGISMLLVAYSLLALLRGASH